MTDESIYPPQRRGRKPPPIDSEQRERALQKALLARKAADVAKAAWPTVRQPHADDRQYLRDILHKHGISHIPPEAEPATVKRLAQLIRRAGLTVSQAEEAVGLKLPVLIEKNPGHPLWWLLATTLEASA
jgi:hypothetical protein